MELDKFDPAFAESNILFEDDFEIGSAYQSGYWTNFVEPTSTLTSSWGADTQYKYAGIYSLSDSPGGNYLPGVNSGTTHLPHYSVITPAINLSGLTQANATFYQRLYLENNGAAACYDAILVKVSNDSVNWNYVGLNGYTERTITDNSQQERTTGDGFAICGDYTTSWTEVSINLNPYIGNQTVYIKWTLIADENTAYDGYNIDNFVVYGTENQNPKLITAPTFNPNSIVLGSDTYLNMTITDDTPVNVIGTMKFANGTIQNYTILPEVKQKIITYNMLQTGVSEKGANVTVFNDIFTNIKNWQVTIGLNLFDWEISGGQLQADSVTAPRPQYATLVPPIDLRNFSAGVVRYQYREDANGVNNANNLEAPDCLYYSLNNASGWTTNTQIFCDDVGNVLIGAQVILNKSYMTENFQFRFGVNQFDAADDDVYIDNFNITAWHNESKTTGMRFGPITYDNYTILTKINVTITVDSYSPNSSVNKSNTKPDLWLSLNDGTSDELLKEVGVFNLSSIYTGSGLNTTDVNFTISITDSTILNYFEANPGTRYIRIGAKDLDYTSSTIYDEIIYKAVYITFEGTGTTGNHAYNFSNIQTPGTHNLTNLYISDMFGLKNDTTYTTVNFTVNAYSKISDGYLSLNNIYLTNTTIMKCQVVDNTSLNPLVNYLVTFYRNTTYLGYNLTDSSGWANFSYVDNSTISSVYNMSCNITSSPSTFYTVSLPNSTSDILYVWGVGADTEKPGVFAGNGSPILNNVGLGFNTWVNATDNEKVERVYLYVKRPGEGTYSSYEMMPPGSANGSGQYNLTFTGDNLAGTYYYYFRAEDNWTNPNWNITGVQSFSRVTSDALIKINNKNTTYKKLNQLEITSYTYASISNTSVGEVSGYIGPYVIFNNSFADEFASWSFYTNPSGTSLYSGDGGAGYENLDTDTGGSATSRTPGTDNSAARFSMEGSSYTLGGSGYAYFEQNLSLAGYTSANATVYLADNGVPTQVGGGYPFTFDIYDGTWYQAFTQDGVGNSDTAIIASDYSLKSISLSGYNMINNFKIRMSGGGTAATTDHFAVDDVLVIAVAQDKTSKSQNYTFGTGNLNLSFFNIQVTIASYDNRGSISNTEPDLSIEFYNGTAFTSKTYCGLDVLYGFSQSSSTTDINCSVEIVDTKIISAWENQNNRKIRVNAEYVDVSSSGSDSINWTNVYLNYYTPSLIYNPGIINVTSYLSNRIYLNSTNELKSVVNVTPITIANGTIYNLSTTWNANNVPLIDLPNGVYYSSSALTDGSGNIITDSNGNEIVSIDYFNLQNMYVNITSPVEAQTYNNSVWFNVTLDTTYYSSGGSCNYTLNSNITSNMTQIDGTHFALMLPSSNFTQFENTVFVICNDSTGDFVVSKIINFNMDTDYVISFIPITDNHNAYVNRSWSYPNVSITTISDTSGFFNFNNSLVTYINFGNVSSNISYDFSVNKNNLTMNGSTINSTNHIRGNYSNYNNSVWSEFINPSVTFKNIAQGKTDFTYSTWVYPRSLSTGAKKIHPIFEAYYLLGTYTYFGIESSWGSENIFFTSYNSWNSNITITPDINWTTNTWMHIAVTSKEINSTHTNISIYHNGNYLISNTTYKSSFSNLTNKYYLGKSVGSGSYMNGSIDEFLMFNRVLSQNEIKALYNSKINKLENNFSSLKNGAYNYSAFVIREDGAYLETEIRTVNINKTLPQITIISPINNYKYNYNETLYFNLTTSSEVSSVYYQLNNNGSNYNMINTSTLSWFNLITNLAGGYYNLTFYAIDDVGNMANASSYFYLVYAKNIYIKKKIENQGLNSYKISLNISNNGNYTAYELHDFIQSNFSYYNLSQTEQNSSNIFGNYFGKILKWALLINSSNSSIIKYDINGTSDYKLLNEFIVGSE